MGPALSNSYFQLTRLMFRCPLSPALDFSVGMVDVELSPFLVFRKQNVHKYQHLGQGRSPAAPFALATGVVVVIVAATQQASA